MAPTSFAGTGGHWWRRPLSQCAHCSGPREPLSAHAGGGFCFYGTRGTAKQHGTRGVRHWRTALLERRCSHVDNACANAEYYAPGYPSHRRRLLAFVVVDSAIVSVRGRRDGRVAFAVALGCAVDARP